MGGERSLETAIPHNRIFLFRQRSSGSCFPPTLEEVVNHTEVCIEDTSAEQGNYSQEEDSENLPPHDKYR